jgi:hypothetical protein
MSGRKKTDLWGKNANRDDSEGGSFRIVSFYGLFKGFGIISGYTKETPVEEGALRI